jgi:hypothetical protein
VARWAAIAVAKLTECGIALGPDVDARDADVVRSAAPQRFVVIAEREQQVNGALV